MQKRKIFLLSACALLLLICILQAVLLNKSSVKTFTLKEEPDRLTIENGGNTILLAKSGDEWVVGDSKYPANSANVDSVVNAVKSVKVLDRVGSASSEASKIRYDLTDSKKVTVTAFAGDKELRKITVGKASSTGSQGYIMIDGSNDVYLASGNLNSIFGKSISDLRSNSVWTLEKNMIGSVSIKKADGTEWKVSREGQAENMTWKIDGHGIVTGEVDGQKAESWFGEFATLTASSWEEDSASPAGTYLLTCEVEAGGKTVALDLFQTKEEKDDQPAEYSASSTETPYTFDLASYSARKFLKNPEELLK
ncbi:hypothetical protein MSI_00540 [Treponema sp. JC4]|uniref:DUF4340 domain-containing protein n=1 Tax=Treponema sp. JC4 TaxID=1124982 RepID=UPI00025AFB2F|nr:DUF4340 domain-containing protein [Treponema sp. JC4]EID86098.1 hypothetical protein MSI_00540 [Treponema sp. JC4]